MKDLNINVQYITRVEGHGNILVNAKDGNIEKICLEISEAQGFLKDLWLVDLGTKFLIYPAEYAEYVQ